MLLLGGTAEARALAEVLVDRGVEVTSSLAGRVARPRLPVGPVRIGGFGGIDGLRVALVDFDLVIDATHPFAQGMSANAVAACEATGTPLLRFERAGWEPRATWHYVEDHDDAARLAATLGQHPLLTVGRQELARFVPDLAGSDVLARVVDTPDLTLPGSWTLLSSRGPYELEGERSLMRSHGTDVLVTKDSGGTFTWPKMEAAEELGVSIVVVRRPDGPEGVPSVDSLDRAVAWLEERR